MTPKALYAYERSQYWLSKANIAIEANKPKHLVEQFERKAQFWLDRLNTLEGLRDSERAS